MKFWICVVLALVLVVPGAWAAEADNPMYQSWSKFKVGAMAKYQQLSEMMGNKTESEIIYTLVEFKTVDQRYDPPESIDYRGILWLLGEKYGTSLHVYNWRYQEKDADKIEARLVEFYRGCTLRG